MFSDLLRHFEINLFSSLIDILPVIRIRMWELRRVGCRDVSRVRLYEPNPSFAWWRHNTGFHIWSDQEMAPNPSLILNLLFSSNCITYMLYMYSNYIAYNPCPKYQNMYPMSLPIHVYSIARFFSEHKSFFNPFV